MSSGSRSQKVRLDDVKKLDDSFAALPEHHNPEIAKSEAIRMLLPRIQTLLKRGYSMPDIAKRLSDGGVPMTAMLLRSYLMRESGTGVRRRNKPKKNREQPESTVVQAGSTETGVTRESASSEVPTANAEKKQPAAPVEQSVAKAKQPESKAAATVEQPAGPKAAPPAPAKSTSGAEEKPSPGKFAIKPDTEDI
jgi:hypothetical protein